MTENDKTTTWVGKRTTWVLQIQEEFQDGKATWREVKRVTVPASTRRKTALRAALKAWGEEIGDGMAVQFLRAEDAEPIPVRPKILEQQLEIG